MWIKVVDWCGEHTSSWSGPGGLGVVAAICFVFVCIYYVFVLYLFRISFVFGAGEEQAVGV